MNLLLYSISRNNFSIMLPGFFSWQRHRRKTLVGQTTAPSSQELVLRPQLVLNYLPILRKHLCWSKRLSRWCDETLILDDLFSGCHAFLRLWLLKLSIYHENWSRGCQERHNRWPRHQIPLYNQRAGVYSSPTSSYWPGSISLAKMVTVFLAKFLGTVSPKYPGSSHYL